MVNMNNTNNTESELYNIHTLSIDVKNREIYLHADLSSEEENGTDYKVAVCLEKNLRYLNILSTDPILIHMHLPGGIWEDALGMYDTIKYSKSKIIVLAYAKVLNRFVRLVITKDNQLKVFARKHAKIAR